MAQPKPSDAYLRAVIAREMLRRVASILRASDVDLMPLKGVLLQATLYAKPEQRHISDLDVLVQEADFRRATAALQANGWQAEQPATPIHSEQTFFHPDFPLPLDLHRRLFAFGRYRLPTKALFRRAHPDGHVFDVPIQLPDPRDTYAHLVGHLADSHPAQMDTRYATDLNLLASQPSSTPAVLARHLDATGLARAARFVLALPGADQHTAAQSVRANLSPDPIGDRVAATARHAAQTRGQRAATTTLVVQCLNTPIKQIPIAAAASVFRAAYKRLHGHT